MITENFKLISEFDNYMISTNGDIWNSKNNEILKKHMTKQGYLFIYLYDNSNKRCCKMVHELVAAEFLQPTDGYTLIQHKDNNKMNNNILNLEYVDKIIITTKTKAFDSFNISF